MTKTTITLTGTGSPLPIAGRAGAGTLIQHGDEYIQIDAGRGTVLRLAEAGVQPNQINALFLTHHHSDHVLDVDDLLIARWIRGNNEPLEVIAPHGPLTRFGEQILDVWQEDLRIRQQHTGRPALALPDWQAFDATRIPQRVWCSEFLTVTSVLVQHEPVRPAVAYRIDTSSGISIVVSGDTRVCEEIQALSQGVDLLVHEVVKPDLLGPGREYIGEYHAEAVALGEMAEAAQVKHLMLTHLEPAPTNHDMERAFEDDIRRGGYKGKVIVGRDLASVTLSGDEA